MTKSVPRGCPPRGVVRSDMAESSGGGGGREIDLEAHAIAIAVARARGAAVQPGDGRHQGEPQAGPGPPTAGLVRPVERLEDMRQVVRRYPGPRVLHGEPDAAAGRLSAGAAHHDAATDGRVLDSVVEQVLDQPGHELVIERRAPRVAFERVHDRQVLLL